MEVAADGSLIAIHMAELRAVGYAHTPSTHEKPIPDS
jgi:hypothetical protein